VNLSGRPLDAARWSENHLAVVQSSRLLSTRAIARAFSLVSKPPGVLLSGSAVGYYGRNPHEGKATVESLTEQSPPGEDDLAQLCVDWERQAAAAAAFAPVVLLRTGLALAPRGGLLQRMWLPFMLGSPFDTLLFWLLIPR
jgi:NAD dependent epimerase/dehydratase family enzyme